MAAWSWFATVKKWWGSSKAYSSTDANNVISQDFRPGSFLSSDLVNDLPTLRAQCRALERTHAPARAACHGLVANIVGQGIALAVDSGDPQLDEKLQAVWDKWVDQCGVNGQTLYALQGMAVRDLPTAGEFVWRLVTLPERAIDGVPTTAILPLESEWISDTATMANGDDGEQLIGGIVFDRLGRAKWYYIADPRLGVSSADAEKVTAALIIHGFEQTRALQARGEPWLAPVVVTMLQESRLVSAELRAAENTAAVAGVVKPKAQLPELTTKANGSLRLDLKPGSIGMLKPGDDFQVIQNTRPSQQISPFRQMLRGDISAALRLGQRWLDRDVSRANYSSLRADMLDSEKLLRPVREWLGHATAGRLFKAILPQLAVIAGVAITRPIGYRLIPDGQPYVDPQKDVAAAKSAIDSGLSTREAEIGARGGDLREITEQQMREQMASDAATIARIEAVQKQCEAFNLAFPGIGLTWAHVFSIGGATTAPGAFLAAASRQQEVTVVQTGDSAEAAQDPAAPDVEEDDEDDQEDEDHGDPDEPTDGADETDE